MSRNPIRRIAALPLALALVGVALIALAALPPNESEQGVAHASSAPDVVGVDLDVQHD